MNRANRLVTVALIALPITLAACAATPDETAASAPAVAHLTFTRADIDALGPGERLAIDLQARAVYRFDPSKGAIDYTRIDVVDEEGVRPISTWLAAVEPACATDSACVEGLRIYGSGYSAEALAAQRGGPGYLKQALPRGMWHCSSNGKVCFWCVYDEGKLQYCDIYLIAR